MIAAQPPARTTFALLAASLLLGGCATAHYGTYKVAERDPLEKFNRSMWNINMAADKAVLKPVSGAYRKVAPRPLRQGITNVFSNLTEPWSFVNNLLQAKPRRAIQNATRFAINTIFGLGGLFDNATRAHVMPAQEDLGQTLATWGIGGGPYLVLPLLGPSSLRDGIGSVAAWYADPVNIGIQQADVSVWYKRGYRVAGVISARSDLTESGGDAFLESSLDPYAAAKSAYLQRRDAQIHNSEDMGDAGPPDEPAPQETTPTPTGDAATAPKPGETPAAPAPAPTDPVATPKP